METTRTYNATRNIIWGALEKIILILVPFATRTVLIKTLGAEYLGLSSLFTSIITVLSISELGVGSAIVFSMYKPIAEKDNTAVCALINLYRKIYLVIGGVILVVGTLITPLVPKLISGECPDDINITILYFIYLINTSISYFLFGYKTALFSAYQRNDILSKCNTVTTIGGNLLKIVMLLCFKNYYTFAIVLPLMTTALNITYYYLANKIFPNIICEGIVEDEIKIGIKKRIMGLLSYKINGVVFSSVDVIIISSTLGLTELARYSNYYYIFTSVAAFLTMINTSFTAGIGNKMASCSIDDNYVLFKKILVANGWIVGWCFVCLACLYQPFIELWVGKEMLLPLSSMILFCAYFLTARIASVALSFREAAGLWWEDRYRPLIATVSNLLLNIILVKVLGLNGILIATLFCTVCINIPWGSAILFRYYFKKTQLEYYKYLGFITVVSILICAISYFVIKGIVTLCGLSPFFELILGAILCTASAILFYYAFRLTPEIGFLDSLLGSFKKRLLNVLNR